MPIDPTNIVEKASSLATSEAVTGSLSDAWQAILGDRIAAWRLANAAKTQIKVQKEFQKLGLKPNADRIPERFAITWFEEASKQDEEEIQDLFARVLAKAASGQQEALDRRNLEIASRLLPQDAALFLELAEGGWGGTPIKDTFSWDTDRPLRAPSNSKVDPQTFNRSFEHLESLGLVRYLTQSEKRVNNRSVRLPPHVETNIKTVFVLTETGTSLYKAIRLTD